MANVNDNWEPKIVAFVCEWCATLAADLAGASRESYPAGVRIVRVPCAGRINPLYIGKALQGGADGVLVYGCNPKDCHHRDGNMLSRRKLALMKRFMSYIGIEPERIQVAWVTASEGTRFSAVANKVVEDVRRLGPNTKLLAKSA